MELWKLGNHGYIIPSTGMVNKPRFLYSSFFPQNSPQDSHREMTEEKKKGIVQIFGTPCHIYWLILPLLWHTAYLHLPFNAILISSDGSCTLLQFFFLPSVFFFFFVAVGFLFDYNLLSFPSFCMGPTARPFIFKCLLNNVGLVKAQSSFFLALSRYVFIIKHVSVSARFISSFCHRSNRSCSSHCCGALLPPCGVRGNCTPSGTGEQKRQKFLY